MRPTGSVMCHPSTDWKRHPNAGENDPIRWRWRWRRPNVVNSVRENVFDHKVVQFSSLLPWFGIIMNTTTQRRMSEPPWRSCVLCARTITHYWPPIPTSLLPLCHFTVFWMVYMNHLTSGSRRRRIAAEDTATEDTARYSRLFIFALKSTFHIHFTRLFTRRPCTPHRRARRPCRVRMNPSLWSFQNSGFFCLATTCNVSVRAVSPYGLVRFS